MKINLLLKKYLVKKEILLKNILYTKCLLLLSKYQFKIMTKCKIAKICKTILTDNILQKKFYIFYIV